MSKDEILEFGDIILYFKDFQQKTKVIESQLSFCNHLELLLFFFSFGSVVHNTNALFFYPVQQNSKAKTRSGKSSNMATQRSNHPCSKKFSSCYHSRGYRLWKIHTSR